MKEYHIAVVDDSPGDREWLAQKLAVYMAQQRLAYTLSTFASGEDFLAALPTARFAIVFMDIYLGGISGIDAAQALRGLDKDCKLVFLTTSADFMRQGFALNSAHYLLKPVQDEDFYQAMENCRVQRQVQVPALLVQSGGQTLEVPTTEIQYLEVQQRTSLLHTTAGVLPLGRTFASLADLLLADQRFLLCYKGLLVNMDFITAQREDDFLLADGSSLPIAPRRRREIMAQYRDYIFNNMRGSQ